MKNTALLLVSVLLALGLAEGALRLGQVQKLWEHSLNGWDWLVYDPVLGWKNQAGRTNPVWTINSLGFRGPEVASSKPPGFFRIVCLGDSGTFGIWNQGPQQLGWHNYPQALAERLQQQAPGQVEVINAGVLGYTSAHGLRQLQTEILKLQPDLVTIRFGFNDQALAWKPILRTSEPASAWGRWWVTHAGSWALGKFFMYVVQTLEEPHKPPFDGPWVSLEAWEKNLLRLVEVSQEAGIKLIFLDYPLRPLERGESPNAPIAQTFMGVKTLPELHERHARYQAVLQKVASATQTPILSTIPAFAQSPRAFFSDYDLVHPNAQGAALIAQLLQQKLQELGWLPAPWVNLPR